MADGQTGLAEKAQQNGQSMLRLLILEDSASGAQTLIDPLREAGYAVTAARVKSPLEFQVALKKQEWDLVLVPVQLASFSAKQALALLKHAKLDIPLIIVREDYADEDVVDALQNGARAVVKKQNIAQLKLVIDRELRDLANHRARHYYERMFRESERRCHALLESSHNAIACVRAGKIIYSNPAFNSLAITVSDNNAPTLTGVVHADDRQTFIDLIKRINQQIANVDRLELRVQGVDGHYFKTTVEASLAHINGQQCVQLVFALSADTQRTTSSAIAAHHNKLGLVSTGEILGALDALLQAEKRSPLAIAYVELDQFDGLVQQVGKGQAEKVADDVAAIIANAIGKQAKLSRHSAHTFTMLLPGTTAKAADNIGKIICETVAKQTQQHREQKFNVSCSVGISLPSAAIKQGVTALAEADTACQHAKQAGGNRSLIADLQQKPAAQADDPALAARQRIRDALASNRFRIVYQPIVNLHAQPFECYDVLTRMLDENDKELMPADFMPAAEQAGLMTALDRWVIQAALRILATQRANQKETSFIIKLSEDSLTDQTLIPWLSKQLQELHVPGDTVIFEIKEASAARCLPSTKQLIQGLKQLRCRTTLGHFGADPHSLDHLEQLGVDFVKLAGSFIDKLSGDSKAELPVKALVQAAHDMGTLTIATFVQEASKMTALWQCNVDYIQGFFLQAPEQDLSYNFNENT